MKCGGGEAGGVRGDACMLPFMAGLDETCRVVGGGGGNVAHKLAISSFGGGSGPEFVNGGGRSFSENVSPFSSLTKGGGGGGRESNWSSLRSLHSISSVLGGGSGRLIILS